MDGLIGGWMEWWMAWLVGEWVVMSARQNPNNQTNQTRFGNSLIFQMSDYVLHPTSAKWIGPAEIWAFTWQNPHFDDDISPLYAQFWTFRKNDTLTGSLKKYCTLNSAAISAVRQTNLSRLPALCQRAPDRFPPVFVVSLWMSRVGLFLLSDARQQCWVTELFNE